MPMFNYRCDKCSKIIEEFVKVYDDAVVCEVCNQPMVKLLGSFRYQFKVGDFFEPYEDTDIHPEGKPIQINTREEFFSQCRNHGRGFRKINDKMR